MKKRKALLFRLQRPASKIHNNARKKQGGPLSYQCYPLLPTWPWCRHEEEGVRSIFVVAKLIRLTMSSSLQNLPATQRPQDHAFVRWAVCMKSPSTKSTKVNLSRPHDNLAKILREQRSESYIFKSLINKQIYMYIEVHTPVPGSYCLITPYEDSYYMLNTLILCDGVMSYLDVFDVPWTSPIQLLIG